MINLIMVCFMLISITAFIGLLIMFGMIVVNQTLNRKIEREIKSGKLLL